MIFMFKAIHFYRQMCMKTLEINILKYMSLVLPIILSAPGLAWKEKQKKD